MHWHVSDMCMIGCFMGVYNGCFLKYFCQTPATSPTHPQVHPWLPTCPAMPQQRLPSPHAICWIRLRACTPPCFDMVPRCERLLPPSATSAAEWNPQPLQPAVWFPRAPPGGEPGHTACPWQRWCCGGSRQWRLQWRTMRTARQLPHCCRCLALWNARGVAGGRRWGLHKMSA